MVWFAPGFRQRDGVMAWLRERGITDAVAVQGRGVALAELVSPAMRESRLDPLQTLFLLVFPAHLDRPGHVVNAARLYVPDVTCWALLPGNPEPRVVRSSDFAPDGSWYPGTDHDGSDDRPGGPPPRPGGSFPNLRLVGSPDAPPSADAPGADAERAGSHGRDARASHAAGDALSGAAPAPGRGTASADDGASLSGVLSDDEMAMLLGLPSDPCGGSGLRACRCPPG